MTYSHIMPMGERNAKEALAMASDWLTMSDAPGKADALDGIANIIPLVMIGEIDPEDIDDLAASVLRHAPSPEAADVESAVNAAFAFAKSRSN